MSEESVPNFSIDQLLKGTTGTQRPRLEKRVVLNIPAFIEINGTLHTVTLIDLSPKALRVDKSFSISYRGNCQVAFQAQIPLQLVCSPIIGEKEFNSGEWNRLAIKTDFDFDKFAKILKKSA